jgi:outer membrane lipoprotein SlyB
LTRRGVLPVRRSLKSLLTEKGFDSPVNKKEEVRDMRKIFVAIMCVVLLTAASMPAWAQTARNRNARYTTQSRRYDNQQRVYYDRRNQDRSFVEEHRDKLTVAAGTGVGAVIGAAVGGKKGAIIGALLGAGGSALYTYKLRDKDDDGRYYRR